MDTFLTAIKSIFVMLPVLAAAILGLVLVGEFIGWGEEYYLYQIGGILIPTLVVWWFWIKRRSEKIN